ncbi:MAG TPA: IclR family transcriptional regulator [Alphaproteobacteria bacterium]|nr:IclR family transcriptional regulator [Alphaproteobacteria bacterium]
MASPKPSSKPAARAKPQAQPRLGIQSVEVAAVILDALAEAPAELALKDLAAAAGMHPGKVHRYLVSLVRTGLVAQNKATSRYGIGPLALKLGLAALRDLEVIRCCAEDLAMLRDAINETVVLSVWGNLGPTVVWIEESGQAVRMNLRIGTVLPVMGTAIGRVFAAHLALPAVKKVVALQRGRIEGAERFTKFGSAEVDAILDDVRARGLSRIDATLVPGVAALAAPIRDYQGSVAAVLAAIGRSQEFDLRWSGPVSQALKDMAASISRRLGYTPSR